MKSLGSMHFGLEVEPTQLAAAEYDEVNKTRQCFRSISPGVLRVQRFEVYTRGYNIPSTLKLEKKVLSQYGFLQNQAMTT